jgi:hypothetical protein
LIRTTIHLGTHDHLVAEGHFRKVCDQVKSLVKEEVSRTLTVTTLAITLAISKMSQPTLKECEDDTYIPEMGTWESFGTPKISELNCRGQNSLP